ncbi:hypothetical protein, partial [Rhodopseudomonas sp. B29]|uniref:hypothetical protein n=1 Tax=Rhodopseudomonas sp. B29 TaxID=95607 RepID=UPI000594D79B
MQRLIGPVVAAESADVGVLFADAAGGSDAGRLAVWLLPPAGLGDFRTASFSGLSVLGRSASESSRSLRPGLPRFGPASMTPGIDTEMQETSSQSRGLSIRMGGRR